MDQNELDYLPNTSLRLFQSDDMFKFNTDTMLLGNFITMKLGLRILDIGCNNGALLLYCSQFKPSQLIGVDIVEQACELAKQNLILNNIENWSIVNCDVKDLMQDQFDVIVSNPPFDDQKASLTRNSDYHNLARFTDELSLDKLIDQVRIRLKDNGHFFMIHRATRINDIIFLLRKNKMSVDKMEFVYHRRETFAQKVLISVVKRANSDCKVYHRNIGD